MHSQDPAAIENRLPELFSGHVDSFAADPPWLRQLREEARGRLLGRLLPDGTSGDSRPVGFPCLDDASLRPLRGADGGMDVALDHPPVTTASEAGARLVFVNGLLHEAVSRTGAGAPGVLVDSLRRRIDSLPDSCRLPLGEEAADADSLFRDLNSMLFVDGAVVFVPRRTVLDDPVHVVFLGTPAPCGMSLPRITVVLEEGAEATLIEEHTGASGGRYLANSVAQIRLGEGSRLDYTVVQREPRSAAHVACVMARVASGGAFRCRLLTLGGRFSTIGSHVTLSGGAGCELYGLFLAGHRQVQNHRTDVVHRGPAGVSRESFRGIAASGARGSFSGSIRVERGAVGSRADRTSRNLLLSRDADIRTFPQAVIEADGVAFSDDATVTNADELPTGGLREAKRTLALGFAAELPETLPWPRLRGAVVRAVGQKLDEMVAGRE